MGVTTHAVVDGRVLGGAGVRFSRAMTLLACLDRAGVGVVQISRQIGWFRIPDCNRGDQQSQQEEQAQKHEFHSVHRAILKPILETATFVHYNSLMSESLRLTCSLLRTANPSEALLIRQLLRTYGIPCRIVPRASVRLFPMAVGEMAGAEILVEGVDADRARALIAEHRRQGLKVLPGGRVS